MEEKAFQINTPSSIECVSVLDYLSLNSLRLKQVGLELGICCEMEK